MNAADLLTALDLPADSRVNQRIPKKLLLENGASTAADRRQINEGVARDPLTLRARLEQNARARPIAEDGGEPVAAHARVIPHGATARGVTRAEPRARNGVRSAATNGQRQLRVTHHIREHVGNALQHHEQRQRERQQRRREAP